MFRCDFVEGWEDTWVAGAAIIQECSTDGLDSGGAKLIKWLGRGFGGRILRFRGFIGWCDPVVRGMLFL